MGFLSKLTTSLAVTGAVLAALPYSIDLLTRQEFPVHNRGVILVTGASTGIGRHAVEALAKQGPYVVYAGVRKPSDAHSLASTNITNLRPILLDVAKEESMVQAHKQILTELDQEGLPFIGLVNNAGLPSSAPLEFLPSSDIRSVFEVNVFGTARLTQLFLPRLRQNKGRIVQITSIMGKLTIPGKSAYCASKSALEAMSDVLRQEMAPFQVSVSVIEPAYVKTEIFKKAKNATQSLLTNEAKEVYGPFLYRPDQVAKRESQIDSGSTPDVTTNAIRHALVDPYPNTHYVVAKIGKVPANVILRLHWLLPVRLTDFVIRQVS